MYILDIGHREYDDTIFERKNWMTFHRHIEMGMEILINMIQK